MLENISCKDSQRCMTSSATLKHVPLPLTQAMSLKSPVAAVSRYKCSVFGEPGILSTLSATRIRPQTTTTSTHGDHIKAFYVAYCC